MKKQTIGDRVKLLRTTYRLTQADFASKVKMSLLTISNLERGVAQNPHPDTIGNIASAFGTTVEWLEEGANEMLPNGMVDISGKQELDSGSPWRDEAYQQIKQENARLWEMVNNFMSGKINFLKPIEETELLPTGTCG